MSNISANIHKAVEAQLTLYNGKAVINRVFEFYYQDPDTGTLSDYDFLDFSAAYFRVFEERSGLELKDLVPTRSSNDLILNASIADMTFDEIGTYYYEIGFTKSGGYDEVLRFGVLYVI